MPTRIVSHRKRSAAILALLPMSWAERMGQPFVKNKILGVRAPRSYVLPNPMATILARSWICGSFPQLIAERSRIDAVPDEPIQSIEDWLNHRPRKILDFKKAHFPDLKPTSHPISIRIPDYLLIRVKEKANAINVPYQSLIKEYIQKGVSFH